MCPYLILEQLATVSNIFFIISTTYVRCFVSFVIFWTELEKKSGSGGKFFGIECDLDKDEDIRNMFEWIKNHPELGQVDVCICNAGKFLLNNNKLVCLIETSFGWKQNFMWPFDFHQKNLPHHEIWVEYPCLTGILNSDALSEEPAETWRKVLNVNVVAASLCAQLSVNMMIEKGKLEIEFTHFHKEVLINNV